MSNKNKLKRITDLFTQGEICHLGEDETGAPVCVWMQKVNSLEEEEARLDAQAARTRVLMDLADVTHPEIQNAQLVIDEWDDDELYTALNNQNYEKCVTEALAELENDFDEETKDGWKVKLEYLRREPALMDDAKLDENDPRRAKWAELNGEYVVAVGEATDKLMAESLAEVKAKGRANVEAEFLKNFRERQALEHYMLENRITKLYYSTRDCEAVLKDEKWIHTNCDHSKRLMATRSEVRELPENVLAKIMATYDEMLLGSKAVANFPETPNS